MKKIGNHLIGKKFNMLTIIGFFDCKWQKELLCKCDCGNIRHFSITQLEQEKVKSCGCYIRKVTYDRNIKHGQNSRKNTTSEYKAWSQMKTRCYSEKYHLFHRYGGRGIKVCERWFNSFENFFTDMGAKPSSKCSLDRINNDGDYEPSNCRWSTTKEQARNQSKNHLIEIDGVVKCASEWGEIYNIPPKIILGRIYRGWSPIDSVLKERIRHKSNKNIN